MKYLVTRTSLHDGAVAPCKGAVRVSTPVRDCRCVKTLAEARSSRWGSDWFSRGSNHREENGMIMCDINPEQVWTIDIGSLEELNAFCAKHESVIVSANRPVYPEFPWSLEIYDEYRE